MVFCSVARFSPGVPRRQKERERRVYFIFGEALKLGVLLLLHTETRRGGDKESGIFLHRNLVRKHEKKKAFKKNK